MKNVEEKKNENWFDCSAYAKTDKMTSSEYFAWLHEQTDADGVLIVPVWNDGNVIRSAHPSYYRCDMDWSKTDLDRLSAETETLLSALSGIAKVYRQLSDSEEENAKILSPELLKVWSVYIRPFDVASFDLDLIHDIEMRMEIMDEVGAIELKRNSGKTLDAYEQNFLKENRSITIDADETQLYDAYRQTLYKQSEQRIGISHAAYQLVIHARRVCRLMSLLAPDVIVNAEKKCLMQAVAFHACAESFTVIEPAED